MIAASRPLAGLSDAVIELKFFFLTESPAPAGQLESRKAGVSRGALGTRRSHPAGPFVND